jgi:hypothetical protein
MEYFIDQDCMFIMWNIKNLAIPIGQIDAKPFGDHGFTHILINLLIVLSLIFQKINNKA